jgi:hypothetical protein
VQHLADAWWDEIRLSDRFPSTLDAYRGSLDRYVLPGLGQLKVRELQPSVVDRFLRSITSASWAKMARSVVSGLGGYALRRDLLEHNPARDLTPITRQRQKPAATLTLGDGRWAMGDGRWVAVWRGRGGVPRAVVPARPQDRLNHRRWVP